MANVTCVRCKDEKPGMDQPPMPTALGQKLQQEVCAACFSEWKTLELKYINEYRLNMMDKQHRTFLTAQMKAFFGYEPAPQGLATVNDTPV